MSLVARFFSRMMLGVCLSLLFMASASSAFAMVHKQVLRVAVGGQITTLDPHFVDLSPNNALAAHIFDRLVIRDENAGLKLSLAESWRVIDATTWEFNLRKNVRFHDGSIFTAEDVVASFDRVHQMKDSPGSFSTYLRAIRSVQIMDKFRVRIRTYTPYPLLLNDLSTISIVPKQLRNSTNEELDSGKNVIGSGPYKLVSWRNRDQVELVRNDEYWGEKPAWTRVVIRTISDNESRVHALISQEVDLIDNVPPQSLATLAGHRLIKKSEKTSGRLIFLHIDTLRDISPHITNKEGQPIANPLRDARVRRALSLAIDRIQLQTQWLGGLAVPTRNLVPPGWMGHYPELLADTFNLAAAKRLLIEAGYPDGFSIVLHGPNNRYLNDAQILRAIGQMWGQLGLNVKVDVMPVKDLLARGARREFSVSLLGWNAVTGEASSPLRALLMTANQEQGGGGFNWGGYSNSRLDDVVDLALRTIDTKRRTSLLQQAVKLAMLDDALVPLYHSVTAWAMRRDLQYTPRADEHTLAYLVRPQHSARP
jgi:peptide/nickel transport system substrate-binding protein